MKRPFAAIVATALLALLVDAFVPAHPQQAKRPNIVIVLADDMGFADMSSFGCEIKTPNLDELATEGIRFTQFYTSATCSPTHARVHFSNAVKYTPIQEP
jgi:arylsulfatase